jgi:hypothetical protein
MSIPGSASPLFLTSAAAAAPAGYQIDRSLRFNDDDDANLSFTPSSSGNMKTFTWSFWLKRSTLGNDYHMIYSTNGELGIYFQFNSSNNLDFGDYYGGSYQYRLVTNRVFRDVSAWYHIVIAVDTTQATASDRIKIYVNGVQETSFSTATYPSQNFEGSVNRASIVNKIGEMSTAGNLDGYLAEFHSVDAQQLSSIDFGEYDDNNLWQPKEFTGTHNPAQVGIIYSSGVSSPDGTIAASPNDATALFNGDTTTNCQTTTNGTTVRWTPPTTVSWSTSLRINTGPYSGSVVVRSNGTNYTLNSNGSQVSSPYWLTHPNSSGTIEYIDAQGHIGAGVGYMKAGVTGFYLDFSDNSSASALGTDAAGSNDWTVNNISVASGSGNDSLIDTPTNYEAGSGNNGGNYATFSPIDSHSSNTFANGNLEATNAGVAVFANLTMGFTSGKWYCEIEADGGGASSCMVGVCDLNQTHANRAYGTTGGLYMYQGTGGLYSGGLGGSFSNGTYGSSYSDGDIIGIGLDMDNGNVRFYINGSDQGQANTSSLAGALVSPAVNNDTNSASFKLNTGQRPFSYTPPTGHKAMCTTNLPDPTIADGSTAMDVKIWTGTGVARSITGYDFSPDLVWGKARSASNSHWLMDTVRGAGKRLISNSAGAEDSPSGILTSFNSDGFSLGTNTEANNSNGTTYVGWAWDGGSSTVSNTDGSITSNVRANASAGFSIIGFTGNATVGATIGHGLNSKPEFFTIKVRGSEANWYTYHKAYGATKYLTLDRTHAAVANTYLNNTEPTSSVITLNNTFEVNGVNENIICLAWTSVAGYSSFGSYQGNGSVDGTFVFTGFRPRFILLKRYDASGHSWNIMDTARSTNNVVAATLFPDSSAAEASSVSMDILSNGFKFRTSSGGPNGSGMDYIYAAYAEHPFASNARAR